MTAAAEITIAGVFTLFSTLAVALRVAARHKTKVRFGWDDYWIFAALLLDYTQLAYAIKVALIGHGNNDLRHLSVAQLTELLKYVYIGGLTFTILISFAKFSVVVLYQRIFGRFLKWNLHAVAAVQTCWMLCVTFIVAFHCSPTRAAWDVTSIPTAKCLNFKTVGLVAESFNAAIDLWLWILPITAIQKLKMSARTKIMVTAVFAVGIFVFATCILRIVETARSDINATTRWVQIQQNMAIICACLPTLKPMMPDQIIRRKISGLMARFSNNTSSPRSTSEDSSTIAAEKLRKTSSWSEKTEADSTIDGNKKCSVCNRCNDNNETDLWSPIEVQTEITINTQPRDPETESRANRMDMFEGRHLETVNQRQRCRYCSLHQAA